MKEKLFKHGDEVYCPRISTKVLDLVDDANFSHITPLDGYPLHILEDGKFRCSISTDGKLCQMELPEVFHATSDNWHHLNGLYGVEFEHPEMRNHEAISQNEKFAEVIMGIMELEENAEIAGHFAFVTDNLGNITEFMGGKRMGNRRFITGFNKGQEFPFISETGYKWKYAVAVDEFGNFKRLP